MRRSRRRECTAARKDLPVKRAKSPNPMTTSKVCRPTKCNIARIHGRKTLARQCPVRTKEGRPPAAQVGSRNTTRVPARTDGRQASGRPYFDVALQPERQETIFSKPSTSSAGFASTSRDRTKAPRTFPTGKKCSKYPIAAAISTLVQGCWRICSSQSSRHTQQFCEKFSAPAARDSMGF